MAMEQKIFSPESLKREEFPSSYETNKTYIVEFEFSLPVSYKPALQMKLYPWLSSSASQRRSLCSGLPAVYQDLSTRHDRPVKKSH